MYEVSWQTYVQVDDNILTFFPAAHPHPEIPRVPPPPPPPSPGMRYTVLEAKGPDSLRAMGKIEFYEIVGV